MTTVVALTTVRNVGRIAVAVATGICATFALVGGAPLSPATAGTFPGDNGTITFARSGEDGFDIVSVRPDGSHRRVVVKSPPGTVSIFSDWSPDGRKLVFDSDRTGNVDIFLRRPGGEIRQLTDNPAVDAYPTWAPNGERIAFESRRSNDRQIYVMNRDGSHEHPITDFKPGAEEPSYSPTGKWIAFLSGKQSGATAVFVVRPDGSQLHRLTPRRLSAGHPSWSPNGRQIVFNNIEVPNGRIWVVGVGGGGLTKLTKGADGVEDFEPTFSPDGRLIAFTSFGRSGDQDADIWVMRADGSRLRNVTPRARAFEVGATWRPRRQL